jgi:hypothetical protein
LPIPLGLGIFIQKIDDFHFPTIENCPQRGKKKNKVKMYLEKLKKLQKTVVLS